MSAERSKRIVFEANPALAAALEQTAASLGMTKIGTIRLAVAILNEIVREASRGGRLILRGPDGTDHELWLPMISRGHEPPAP